MFNKKGEVKNEFAVDGFNKFINSLTSDIINYAKGESIDKNW